MRVTIGEKFPDFSLPDTDGKTVQLADFQGKNLVIYFYPKDDTPGCTVEGKQFTQLQGEFQGKGVEILGVSVDDSASHQKFCEKHSLTIRLLADTERELVGALGIVKPTKSRGAKRTTFLVDGEGKIIKIYENVKALGHAKRVLADIEVAFE